MASHSRRLTERPAGSWRPSDAELGWIIENRIDEAYVLSWPGQLETWVPVHDTGGYDRARAPMGSYDYRLDQIKGTASLRSGNQVHLSFDTPALHPRPNLHFTIVYFDLAARGPADPVWKVPSMELDRVCVRVPGRGDSRWMFAASRSGLAHDRAAKYQIAMRDLAGSQGWSVLPPKLPPSPLAGEDRVGGSQAVSAQPLEANAFSSAPSTLHSSRQRLATRSSWRPNPMFSAVIASPSQSQRARGRQSPYTAAQQPARRS